MEIILNYHRSHFVALYYNTAQENLRRKEQFMALGISLLLVLFFLKIFSDYPSAISLFFLAIAFSIAALYRLWASEIKYYKLKKEVEEYLRAVETTKSYALQVDEAAISIKYDGKIEATPWEEINHLEVDEAKIYLRSEETTLLIPAKSMSVEEYESLTHFIAQKKTDKSMKT